MLLPLVIAYVACGVTFFSYYMGAPVLDSIVFIVNLTFFTGLTDIVDYVPDDWVYSLDFAHMFLVLYTMVGILVLFQFAETYFGKLLDSLWENANSVDDSICECTGGRFPYLQSKRTRWFIYSLFFLWALGTVVFKQAEGWDWAQSVCFTVATMITTAFLDVDVDSDVGKWMLICWIPGATLLTAYIMSDYVAFHEKHRSSRKREHLLDSLLQTPGDLLFLADSEGRVSQNAFIKHMLLQLGLVKHDEFSILEERYNGLYASLPESGPSSKVPSHLDLTVLSKKRLRRLSSMSGDKMSRFEPICSDWSTS